MASRVPWWLLLAAACSPPSSGGQVTMLASTDVFDKSVTVTWTDTANGEASLSIERSEVSSTAGFNQVGSVAANVTRFVDRSVQPSTNYWYRVVAVYADGTRSISATLLVTTQLPITVPSAPSGLVAKGISETELVLTWVDNSANETGFELERSPTQTGTYATAASIAADAVTHTDTGLTKDTSYWYRIRSSNSAGASPWSLPAGSKTYITNDMLAPSVPQNVTVLATSPSSIDIVWAASTDDASGVASYRLLQNTIEVATLPASNLGHSAILLASGAQYCFQVAAVDVVGNRSMPSMPQACATTPQVGSVPAAPTLADAGMIGQSSVTLTWRDNSNNELGFRVERAVAESGPYAGLLKPDGGFPSTPANTTLYVAAGLTPATQYFFRVRAVSDGGFSSSADCAAMTLP